MGILRSINKALDKGEQKYEKAKKSYKEAEKTGTRILDIVLPPQKKKKAKPRDVKTRTTRTKKSGKSKTSTVKIGNCVCKCPE